MGWGGGNGLPTFYGHLAELRVSNVARYSGAFAKPSAPFETDANTNLLIHAGPENHPDPFEPSDSSDSSHAITVKGETQSTREESTNAKLVEAMGYVQPESPLQKFTISLWARRLEGFGEHRYMWSVKNGGSGNGLDGLTFGDSNYISFGVQHMNDRVNTAKAYDAPDGARWNHIVGAFDSTLVKETDRLKLFVNGERIEGDAIKGPGDASYPAQGSSGNRRTLEPHYATFHSSYRRCV